MDGEGEGVNPGPPPPIPGNRPILDRPLVSAPPPLPVRSQTVATTVPSEPVTPYRPPPPPSFPARQLDATRLDRSVSVSSNRLASRNSSRQASPLPPPSRDALQDGGEVYKPLPPPVRKATAAPPLDLPPSRRQASDPVSDEEGGARDYGSDEDEDDDNTGCADLSYVPSSQQFKKVDDLPDFTMSNRRPPVLRPDSLKITGTGGSHHITAFASSGGTVAVGSYHLRVYDVDDQNEHGPSLLWDQKEMGLEVKAKDPKITALCFRPTVDEGEMARFLWCGSKDGHLWEVDVWGSAVIQSRSHAHAVPVSAIVKYRESMLTLDETGKALVYTMNEGGSFNINIPTQTLRLAERQSFVVLLGHQLWTSSGPVTSTSSVKTAASRGPTIRVYEPFGESLLGAGGKLLSLPDTVAGAVLSAAVIPSNVNLVFLGHEGGQISIWSKETLTCTKVLKISTSGVLSLVGIGSKLWAGSRTGGITVYDVETRPWTITNLWKAHECVSFVLPAANVILTSSFMSNSGAPVLGFEVDVTSIQHVRLVFAPCSQTPSR